MAIAAVAGILAHGCASDPAADPAPDAPPVADVRVAIPAPDPAYVDIVSPDLTIAPGHEAIYCYYTNNPIGRFGSDGVDAKQGTGGHHVAFRHAQTHRPEGTFEDCTNDQETLQLGDLFVGSTFPPGWATEIPADAQFVLEMHYQNSGDLPILARDVIRVHRMPDAQITKWIHPMHLKIYDLLIGPGETTLAFDCTVPEDVVLYEFWGHQHGLGKRQSVDVTPPDGPAYSLYNATWGIDPLVWGSADDPVTLVAGTQLHVSCTWNPAGKQVKFPDEMCAFGGYIDGAELSCAPPSYTP